MTKDEFKEAIYDGIIASMPDPRFVREEIYNAIKYIRLEMHEKDRKKTE